MWGEDIGLDENSFSGTIWVHVGLVLKCLYIEIFGAVFISESQYSVFPEYFDV